MPRIPIKITAAIVLLVGAGAIVTWKQWSSDSPEKALEPAARVSSGSPRPLDAAAANSARLKWSPLADDEIPRAVRLDLARQIDSDLTASEADLLLGLLHRKPTAGSNESWWVVMNEIMEQMRKKGVAPERFGHELISLVGDGGQSEVVRDYAVQHLSLWVAPAGSDSPAEPSPEVAARALQSIAATITDPSIAHTSIPGTAIMALTSASAHLPPEATALVWEKLDPAMTSMLNGGIDVPLSTRTTVIQALAIRGSADHLPLVRDLARDEAADPSLRLSSIAALGIYQSEDDRAYLSQLAASATPYRHAAQSALRKLSR